MIYGSTPILFETNCWTACISIKTEKYRDGKIAEKVTLPVVGLVHIKAPAFNINTHFEATACTAVDKERDSMMLFIGYSEKGNRNSILSTKTAW